MLTGKSNPFVYTSPRYLAWLPGGSIIQAPSLNQCLLLTRTQFILTIGTIILGAYVAVRVFGLDVSAVGEGGAGSSRNKRASKGGGSRRGGAGSAAKRASGGVAGLLGAIAGSDTEEDDGLLDVWFEKKGSKPRKSSR